MTQPTASLLPRERALLDGFDALGDAELIALVLGTGHAGASVTRVAEALVERLGGLEGLLRAGVHDVAGQAGVGLAKAARLRAAVELGRRSVARASSAGRLALGSSADVAAWARGRIGHLDHEEVWLLSLDGRNGLRGARRIGQGGLHGAPLQPRDAMRAAVRDAASACVLVHNHPAGNPEPSREDLEVTRAVARAADIVGIPLVDHVIVGGGSHVSLFDRGLLAPPEP